MGDSSFALECKKYWQMDLFYQNVPFSHLKIYLLLTAMAKTPPTIVKIKFQEDISFPLESLGEIFEF